MRWLPRLAPLVLVLSGIPAPPGQTTPTQPRQRTEEEARKVAADNRAAREQQRQQTGAPVELIPSYLKAVIGPVPASLGVSPFYKKYVDAQGIPVISSEKVPDDALVVARDIVITMLSARPDLRKALIDRRWRTGVIAEVEMTADIPEYANRKRPGAPAGEPVTQLDRDYHAWRSRGLGGNPTTGAEENLLGYPGTRYFGEHIFVHEFSHAIMGGAIRTVDPAMFAEIHASYDKAMAAGKYVHPDGRKHYATTNAGESIFGVVAAEGAQSVTMMGLDGKERAVARDELKSLESTNRSLMPDAFESAISRQQMADLITFLKMPEATK